jgi:hypothetical protein
MAGLSAWGLLRYATTRSRLARLAVVGVLLLDLGSVAYLCAWRYRPPGKLQQPDPALVELLSARDESSLPPRYVLFSHWGQVQPVLPQYNMLHDFESLNGYGPFQLRRYQQMLGGMHHGGFVDDATILCPGVVLDVWSCRYVVVREDEADLLPDCFKDRQQYQLAASLEDVQIYENMNVLPRAWFVDETIQLEKDDDILEAMISGELRDGATYDPRQNALVLSGTGIVQTSEPSSDVTRDSQLSWQSCRPGRLALKTETEHATMLILANPYMAGWQATIDGQATSIQRVNYLLQGIKVPEGQHEIALVYAPKSVARGMWLSAIGLVALLVVILWSLLPQQSVHEPEAGQSED